MKRLSYYISVCALLSCAACIDTGQQRAVIELRAAGSDVAAPFAVDTDWQVSLDTAELAFGPLWLCAGPQAGSLCDTARAEWIDSAVIDALDPAPHSVGTMDALTGPVRSWMCDLGIASLLTQSDPAVLAAAQTLGGNSVRLAGTASRGGDTIAFEVELAIQQEQETETGVPVIRSAVADGLEHDIAADGERLTVRFDPRPWLSAVDFDRLCDSGGCPAAVTFAPEGQAWRAVRNQLLAGQRPVFEFDD